ncbi:type-F conjugative transfer system secretin TraK [Lamprobacter modestohalophilus]|uniref:TraK domain-containing protein n=1 Tax=Lamprobacter modestohalophilus TaxID=1064514 RepID=UPI002ADEEC27|nr:type-F conjugative transfer system secretin TraK [Lamprobacter modestohalophilus]MEA1052569.1 type-F conjugative transfer system secretin TraK [Lamprobacter modestohalophilus]
MTFFPLSVARSAPRTPRLLLPVMLTLVSITLVGTTPPLHADSPFLRGSARAAQTAASASTPATGAATDSADPDEPAVLALGPRTVTVAPGANAILELAIDHLNRIVTPFERPSVRTVSDLSTEVEGKVVYVATASEVPATLYISAGDASGTTIALTLAPRRVPPREIRLQVPGYRAAQAPSNNKAQTTMETQSDSAPVALSPAHPALWQQPLPYLQTLTTALRDLARGETPEGFRRGSVRPEDRLRCEAAGLRASDVEVFEREHLTLLKATLRYSGKQPLGITAHHCRPRGKGVIAAQATWPRTELRKGEETQLLLALRVGEATVPLPVSPGRTTTATRTLEAHR